MPKKEGVMKILMGVFLVMLTVVAIPANYAADVSESSVMALIGQMDKASRARDVGTMAKLLSANCNASGTLTNNAGK